MQSPRSSCAPLHASEQIRELQNQPQPDSVLMDIQAGGKER